MTKYLIVGPKFDSATDISYVWVNELIEKMKLETGGELTFSANVTVLLDDNATLSKFDKEIVNHDVVIFFDHGDENSLVGQNGERIVTLNDVEKLKDKKVYTMACLSSQKLGRKAFDKGTSEYWGATEPIGFTIGDANLFGEVYVKGALDRYIGNKTIEEVYESMRKHFDEQQTKTLNPWTKIWLQKDKDIWTVYHSGNPPPPYIELTWWQRFINWLRDIIGLTSEADPFKALKNCGIS